MLVIVTRPAEQAASWVQALQAQGAQAQALPLIEIAPSADAAPVRAAWQALATFDLAMFVSANAVAHFFAQAPAGWRWPARLQAASTGPGTTAALRAAGVPAAQVTAPDAQAASFDSETLWQQLAGQHWAGRRALIVRGEGGRDWLADRLRAAGAEVQFVAAYARRAPVPDGTAAALLQRALDQPEAHLWWFSSSEAVAHLRALAPRASWARSRAVASHERIAQAARAAGFGAVVQLEASTEPALQVAALAAAWPSIQSAAS